MTPEAKAARSAYLRQWRKNNPDRVKAANEKYWEQKVKKMEAAEQKNK